MADVIYDHAIYDHDLCMKKKGTVIRACGSLPGGRRQWWYLQIVSCFADIV